MTTLLRRLDVWLGWAALALLVTCLGGCGLGLRVTAAPASGAVASVEGPGGTVTVQDKAGDTLFGFSAAINPVVLAENLWAWVYGLYDKQAAAKTPGT